MKDQILKIAKVKSEKEFYKKYPSEEAFMKAHGKAFKKAAMGKSMVNKQLHQLTDFGNPPIAQVGATTPPKFEFTKPESFGAGAETAGMSALQSLDKIAGGIEAINQQKKAIKKADGQAQIAGLSLQAQQTMKPPKNQYVRPEDSLVQPGQLGNPYGTGTNYLQAEDGAMIGGNPTEIQNMYNPGDMYDDLGYEPLEEAYKQYRRGGNMPKAEFGEYFQDSGQAQIGSVAGEAIGSAFGPAGAAVGKFAGKILGNALGGAKDARALQAQKDKTAMNTSMMGFEQARSQGPLNANVKNGGWVSHDWQPQTFTKFGEYSAKDLLKPPHDADMLRAGGSIGSGYYTPPSARALQTYEYGGQMALGGELQIGEGGYAETLSYNPNLPGGEIGMFRGASHDNGGIQTQYGENGVEVEGGEPFTVLEDNGSEDGNNLEGGGSKENLVVFGNIKINKEIADLIGDPKAKGKKFKTYIADVAKNDAKQLKTIQKGLDLIEEYDGNSSYDKLGMNSGMANLMGAKAQQKINADKIKEAGLVQDSIHKVANEYGVKSDKLAEGKFEKETDPSMVAQKGVELPNGPLDGVIRKSYNAQLPLFARMLGAKPKPNYFNLEMINTLMNPQDRSYMINKLYNPDLSNALMAGDTRPAAAGPGFNPDFTDQMMAGDRRTTSSGSNYNPAFDSAMMYGIPYNQKATPASTSSSASAYNPITKTSNTIVSQTPTSNKPVIAAASSAKGKGKGKGKGKSDDSVQLRRLDVENMPNIIPASRNLTIPKLVNLPKGFAERAMASAERVSPAIDNENSKGNFWNKAGGIGLAALSNLENYLRPSNANDDLPPDQLYPEYLALATNQLEAVQAQQFQPMLDTPYDISLNDQINAIDSQARAAIRAGGNNPAAQSIIMSQAIEAKNRVLGEQTRVNQANKMQVYDKNRATLNDAQLKNLQILDQQYVRQSQAKSNTKAQTQAALSSIAAKTAQQRATNRKLAIMENMYGFRFSPSGRAINMNAPAQFNMSGDQSGSFKTDAYGNQMYPIYNPKTGKIKGYSVAESSGPSMDDLDDLKKNGGKTSNKKARNRSIVKALKNL